MQEKDIVEFAWESKKTVFNLEVPDAKRFELYKDYLPQFLNILESNRKERLKELRLPVTRGSYRLILENLCKQLDERFKAVLSFETM